MKKKLAILLLGLSSGLWSAMATADSHLASSFESTFEGRPYLNGGIGDEEREAIQAREKEFNLKLVFAEKGGSYLADVDVLVMNPQGEPVFQLESAGPMVLTKLPAGDYQLKVSSQGQVQQMRFGLAGKRRLERTFIW